MQNGFLHPHISLSSAKNMGALKQVFRRSHSKYLQALEEAKPGDGVAFRLNAKVVVKTGDKARMLEAAVMRFLAAKTSIPVPRVHDAYLQPDGCGVLIMEHVEGTPLLQAWPYYDQAQKQSIIAQLRHHLEELRSVTSDTISSIDRQPCLDEFFAGHDLQYGPYNDPSAFVEGLVHTLRQRGDNPWTHMVARLLRSMRSDKIVLTHNNLTPGNILVRDGMVVAILDWEMCGFYPDYWEFVKAYLFADWNGMWVQEKIPDRILTPRLAELSFLMHARSCVWPGF
ncbi:hypothetical protein CERZMDRAFT_115518 [Cercospora zeae-maydis SCOH1-5]|uniref:Aminoglycoside phosphotransferase domain-containing protein n=1 Tax=Cercospora zeae-maydis SCOH1-5 TaxID=717836 RepID=A0A6A6F2X5_9PEZI|nr:hypothetical protein CERZMDRAFT_115518 [Cercospora zeae-maydis SCOH1-5]